MKFKNIKVGDQVLVPISIRLGWYRTESFMIYVQVTKVTPKQFVACGEKYKKDTGAVIGGYSYAYNEGDKIKGFVGRLAKDETKDMNIFVEKEELIIKANNIINNSKVTLSWSCSDMQVIIDLLSKYSKEG